MGKVPYQATISDESDEKLIAAFKNGDSESFGTIAKRHTAAILATICRKIKDRQTADDVLQDALIRGMEALKKGHYVHVNLRGWLCKIGHNLAINHLRKQGKIQNVDPLFLSYNNEAGFDVLEVFTQSGDQSPEDILIEKNETHLTNLSIHQSLNELSPKYKEVIILSYFNDMKYEEIAEFLNIPLGTVKSRIFLAKEELRKNIKKK